MKKYLIIMAVIAAFVSAELSSYAVHTQGGPSVAGIFDKKKKDIRTVVLSANIHCKSCAKKIEENIGFEKGVVGLEVSVEKRQAVIKYDAAKTSVETLLAAMKKLGYPAKVVE